MEENKPRVASLSPKAMVDSVADWSLHQVIEHLKKRDKDADIQPSRLHCRSTIKSLVDVIDDLSARYETSRNRMTRWLSYHALAFAREDVAISKLSAVQSTIRSRCLISDDTDTLDIMNSLTPYTPRLVTEEPVHLFLYDSWVSSDFDEMARTCGVFRYRIIQIYLIKSILSDGPEQFGETANRLLMEVDRWNSWVDFRLGALETLAEKISGKNGK